MYWCNFPLVSPLTAPFNLYPFSTWFRMSLLCPFSTVWLTSLECLCSSDMWFWGFKPTQALTRRGNVLGKNWKSRWLWQNSSNTRINISRALDNVADSRFSDRRVVIFKVELNKTDDCLMTSLFTFISKILPAVFRWNIFITSWTQKLKELVKFGDTLVYSLFLALRWSGQADARKSRVKTVVGGRPPLVLFRYRLFQPWVFTRPVSVNWEPRTGKPFQDSNLNVCKTTVRNPLGNSYIKNMLRYHLFKTSGLQSDNRIFGPGKFSELSRNRSQARVPFRPFSQPLKCCSSHNCKDHSLKISSTLTSKFSKTHEGLNFYLNMFSMQFLCLKRALTTGVPSGTSGAFRR